SPFTGTLHDCPHGPVPGPDSGRRVNALERMFSNLYPNRRRATFGPMGSRYR
ncbi:hypothetical protein FA13DRAFT_1732120, partial [Coprinellus micaceus]